MNNIKTPLPRFDQPGKYPDIFFFFSFHLPSVRTQVPLSPKSRERCPCARRTVWNDGNSRQRSYKTRCVHYKSIKNVVYNVTMFCVCRCRETGNRNKLAGKNEDRGLLHAGRCFLYCAVLCTTPEREYCFSSVRHTSDRIVLEYNNMYLSSL